MQSKKMGYMSAIILAALLVQPAAAVDINVNTAITTSTNFNGALNIGNSTPNVVVTMTSGATVQNTSGSIGNGKTNNTVTISDSGTLWNNTADLTIGSSAGNVLNVNAGTVKSTTLTMRGAQGQMNIANGGKLYSNWTGNSSSIGTVAGANNNTVIVTGSGSIWTNAGSGYLPLGLYPVAAHSNSLIIADGGKVYSQIYIGGHSGARDNTVTVTGSGSMLNCSASLWMQGTGSRLYVTNGGAVYNGAGILYLGSQNNNASIIVSDANSYVTNSAEIRLGDRGANCSLIVTNGGLVVNSGAFGVGYNASDIVHSNNYVIVTGSGSILRNTSTFSVGTGSGGIGGRLGRVTIADGGQVYNTALSIGNFNGADSNTVIVTGGGLLDSTSITVGNASSSANTLTNSGGILQFSTATPTITTNNPAGGNVIVMDSGTLSYRDTGATAVNLTNNWGKTGVAAFTWLGTNSFRLQNATAANTLGRPYEFTSALGPTNFARLEIVNGISTLNGASGITIASDGSLLISGAEVRFQGPVTNNSANAVLANAVVEVSQLSNQSGAALTNFGSGRISAGFQFTNSTPFIDAGAGIALQDGVLSYRSVTDADVRANQVGWAGENDSAHITLLGSNGFELNWATNSAATPQDYTFSAGLGADNFAGLAMVNGTTRFRNGAVTIAPDGWLLITNTVAIFDGAVTNLGSAQTVNSKVTYSSAFVTTNGAGNQVLNSTVSYNDGYVNLSGGGITNWIINSVLGGSGYTVSSGDLLGFGTTTFWGVDTNSCAGFQIASDGSMWVSNNTYTVFTVPLTNAGDVLVSENGVLEVKAISNSGTINSDGGYLLFATNYPAITGAAGIVVTNGGIGYGGGIATADINANRPGFPLANDTTSITWQSPTRFMLNSGAMNTVAASQSYTFDPEAGSPIFAGLVLGGSSVYRTLGGDTVTFTNNASMLMLGSTATYTIGNGVSNVTYNVCGTDGGGTVWDNGARPLVIGNNAAQGNMVNVIGGLVTNSGAVTVGNTAGSVGNSLSMAGGGILYSAGSSVIGNAAGASSNTVTVTDAGSAWRGSGALMIGNNAASTGNVLNVLNSGVVSGTTLDMKGFQGQLNITGSGKLYNSGASIIGNAANSNQANVLSGGLWNPGAQAVTVGSGTAVGNVLTVNAGVVANVGTLTVGTAAGSTGNSIVITDGGQMLSTGGSINAGASNTVTVTGSGSVWTNTGAVVFGNGTANRVIISNGGQFYQNGGNNTLIVDKGVSNTVTVTGSGSVWRNINNAIQLNRNGGTDNGVIVSDGGLLRSDAGSDGNIIALNGTAYVTVTGSGSVWNNTSSLDFGRDWGSGRGTLTIADGGRVYNTSVIIGKIGKNGGGSGHMVTVTDPGSIWTNNGTLTMGNKSSNMTVTNQGSVFSTSGVIGSVANANSNTVTVTDSGSVWNMGGGALTIGVAGAINNALTVSNNGVVTNVNALSISATNTLNLLGGTVYASSLSMGVGAKIGFDRAQPGSLKVSGSAALNGTLDLAAFNVPAGTKEMFNVLTYGTTLSGSLTLAGAPPSAGQFATLTTNTETKAIVLTVWRPGGTLIRIY